MRFTSLALAFALPAMYAMAAPNAMTVTNNIHHVENQWGSACSEWREGGTWMLGGRFAQRMVAVDIQATENGKGFEGTVTYKGEGPIKLRAKQIVANTYEVENQWGNDGEWHAGGTWLIGGRSDKQVTKLKLESEDEGKTLEGRMAYEGEGEIRFRSNPADGIPYLVENQWNNNGQWHPGGIWIMGGRTHQAIKQMKVDVNDTLDGTITYCGEGQINFKGEGFGYNNYKVEVKWGGDGWKSGGTWVLGCRKDQALKGIDIASTDEGVSLTGTITYQGEGPIAFQGVRMDY